MSFRVVVCRRTSIVSLALLLSACGSGGDGVGVATPPPTGDSGDVTISGTVSKGPLDAADIELLPIDAFGAVSGVAVATAVTGADGRFSATIPPGSGALLVRTSGGSYVDEADREPDPALKRRVLLGQNDGLEGLLPAGETTLTVSIATQALLVKTRRETVAGTFLQQFDANRELATAAFGFDIVTVAPASPVSPDPAASVAARQYAMALGGFANLVNRIALDAGLVAPTIEAIRAAADDLSDGRIDGLMDGTPAMIGTPVMIGNQAIGVFDLAEEITRFRNNNFDAYASTPLLVVDEDVLSLPGVPDNEIPVANPDLYTLSIGEALVIATPGVLGDGVLVNDTDADGNPLTAELIGAGPAEAAAFGLAPDGSFVYTHDGSPGSVMDSFSYRATDGLAVSATVTVTLDVRNTTPIANDDAATVDEDGLLSAPSVLTNDSDADPNDTLTAVLLSSTTNGLLTLNPDGTFEYNHDGSETPTDSFTYAANDGSVNSAPATVAITVNLFDDTPVANPDSLTVDEDATVNTLNGGAISVLANDFDEEMAPLTAMLDTTTLNGLLLLNDDGTFSYTHDGSETTTDSFTYTVTDGNTVSAPGMVSILINPVNDAPVAVADSLTVDEGAIQTLLDGGSASVLSNDFDAEMDTLGANPGDPPANGSLMLNPDGTFEYTHDGSNTQSDAFSYTAGDGTDISNEASVSVTINPVNDPPTTSGIADVNVIENAAPVVIDLFAAFDDEEDDDSALSYVVESNTAPDLVRTAIEGPAGTLTLEFGRLLFGAADIAVSATDTGTPPLSVTATFVVTVDGLPQAVDDGGAGFQTSQNVTFVTGNVLVNDDLADQPTTITAFDNPSTLGATVSVAGTGTFNYTPALDVSGIDTFSYTITDANGDSSTANVTISVAASGNQQPTAIDLDNATVDEDLPPGTRVGSFATTDPDPSDMHFYTLVSGTGDDDNAIFQVVGSELQTATILDAEQLPSLLLSIRVRTDDQNGGIYEDAFTIEVNDLPEPISWNNPNGGVWTDPGNWTPVGVPMPNNGVLIDIVGASPTVIVPAGFDASIRDIQCFDRLVIESGASLTIADAPPQTNASIDNLLLEPGATLTSSAAMLTVVPESIDGGTLLALAGGTLAINLDLALTLQSDTAWRAEGNGSALTMFFTDIELGVQGQGANPVLTVEALDGGLVDLPNLSTMIVNDGPDAGAREIDILSRDPGSRVLLPQLLAFVDGDPDPGAQTDGMSSFTVFAGAEIGIPSLSEPDGVSFSLDGPSTIDIAQLVSVRDAVLTVDGGNRTFDNLMDLTGTRIISQAGALANFPVVNQFDDGQAEAFGGSVIVLPMLTQYWTFGDALWQAEGAGSRLELPNLTIARVGAIKGSAMPDRATWQVSAFGGGVVECPTMADLFVFNSVSPQPHNVELRADGAASLIDMQSLDQLDDQDQDPPDDSCIGASNGGVVNLPPTVLLNGVSPAPCP